MRSPISLCSDACAVSILALGLLACGPPSDMPVASATQTGTVTGKGTSSSSGEGTSSSSGEGTSSSSGALQCPEEAVGGDTCSAAGGQCEYDSERCGSGVDVCTCLRSEWACECKYPDYPSCDVWSQDCPDGEKCAAHASDGGGVLNSFQCVPVVREPKGLGDKCTVFDGMGFDGADDCGAGMLCWNPLGGEGYCLGYCEGSLDEPKCSSPGTKCSKNSADIPVCLHTCNPLSVGECGEGETCIVWSFYVEGSSKDLGCLPTSGLAGDVGDACINSYQCSYGLHCIEAKSVPFCDKGSCCTPFCSITDPNSCPAQEMGVMCHTLFLDAEPPPGVEDVGLCAVQFP